MPDPVQILVLPLAISAAVALVVLLAGCARRWAGPLAISVGFVAGFRHISEAFPQFPPRSATDWLFCIAIGMGVAGVALSLARPARLLSVAVNALLFTTAFTLVLWRRLQNGAGLAEPVGWISLLAVASLLWWVILQRNDDAIGPLIGPLAMLLLAMFCAAILIMSGSILYGRLSAATAGAVMPLVLLRLWNRRQKLEEAAATVVALLLGLLAAGYFFAEVSPLSLGLILTSPPLLLLPCLFAKEPAANRRAMMWRSMACLGFLMLPLLFAAIRLLQGFVHNLAETSGAGGQ